MAYGQYPACQLILSGLWHQQRPELPPAHGPDRINWQAVALALASAGMAGDAGQKQLCPPTQLGQ